MNRLDAWVAALAGFAAVSGRVEVPPAPCDGSPTRVVEPETDDEAHVSDVSFEGTADDVREWQAAELARLAELTEGGLSSLEACQVRLAELGGAVDGSGVSSPARACVAPEAREGASPVST
ncbi:hypothetical protein ABZ917_17715 [Nonomuraea wenchangensis]